MKKRSKIVLVIVATIVISAVVTGLLVVKSIESNLEELAKMSLREINLDEIPDGTYSGSLSVFPVSAIADVTVKNREVAEINLVKHFHGKGEAAEAISYDLVRAQALKVDVISGATYSSMLILKAIEDALGSDK